MKQFVMNIPIWRVVAEMMVRSTTYYKPYKRRLCLHFLCSCPPLPIPVSLSQPPCVLRQVTGVNVSENAKTRLGQNLWARMLFFAKYATSTDSQFLLPSLLRPRLKWIDTEGSAAGARQLKYVCFCAVLYISYVDLAYQPWRIQL